MIPTTRLGRGFFVYQILKLNIRLVEEPYSNCLTSEHKWPNYRINILAEFRHSLYTVITFQELSAGTAGSGNLAFILLRVAEKAGGN